MYIYMYPIFPAARLFLPQQPQQSPAARHIRRPRQLGQPRGFHRQGMEGRRLVGDQGSLTRNVGECWGMSGELKSAKMWKLLSLGGFRMCLGLEELGRVWKSEKWGTFTQKKWGVILIKSGDRQRTMKIEATEMGKTMGISPAKINLALL